jgi:hypothetical protein
MDDRPATAQFPQQTAAICGAHLVMPPPQLLGHFTQPGETDALGRWLLDLDTTGLSALVVSSDMLAYGGLVASRTAATPLADAQARIRTLARFHDLHPGLPIYVFGTIMRLTPTETPQSEPYLDALASYARAAGASHPGLDETAQLAAWRAKIPDGAYWDYIGARARDVDIDAALITLAAQGAVNWLAITQDDAGAPDGLQRVEQRHLAGLVAQLHADDRVLLSSGADEMGMVAVTRAIEDAAGWHPPISIEYSSPKGPSVQDPLEDIPVGQTIAGIVRALGLPTTGYLMDVKLHVIVPVASPDDLRPYLRSLTGDVSKGYRVAIVDLTFIADDLAQERMTVQSLRDAGVAARPVAYASWNTTANSTGTALSAAACFSLAEHFGVEEAQARENFLFDRYVDDYAYRLLVRPGLNADLRAQGYDTYALGANSAAAESQMRRLLWPLAIELFDGSFAPDGWRQAQTSMYLPWQRTFEIKLDTMLDHDRP